MLVAMPRLCAAVPFSPLLTLCPYICVEDHTGGYARAREMAIDLFPRLSCMGEGTGSLGAKLMHCIQDHASISYSIPAPSLVQLLGS